MADILGLGLSRYPGLYMHEALDKVFTHRGHAEAARFVANRLSEEGLPLPYAYRLRYERGLAHAFINTLIFWMWTARGYPIRSCRST